MTSFGYTMMTEQARPDQLVADVVAAEAAGFEFSVCSDHFQPWLAEQGHAGYAWSILGAAAYATERIGLMTYVTCPTTLSPGDRRPEGGDAADPLGQPLPARAGLRREPQRARRRQPLAGSASATRC